MPLGAAAARAFHELTVRLRDDDGALVPPGGVHPGGRALQRHVGDRPLGGGAGRSSCCAQRQRRGAALPLLAVNLSGTSLNEQSFVDFVLQSVGEPAMAAALCFEITETAAVTSLSNAPLPHERAQGARLQVRAR